MTTVMTLIIFGLFIHQAYAATNVANRDSATEIVETIVTRVDGDYARLDVLDLVKGEYVPKEVRVHPGGPPLTTIVEAGQRYILFLYDHATIHPDTTFRITEDGTCFCESPTLAMKAWDFKASYRDHEVASESALRALLLAGEWWEYSNVYSVQPSAGYPLVFRPSGQITRDEVGNPNKIPESWSIPGRALLRLRSASGQTRDYRFDAEHGVFHHVLFHHEMPILMLIAPSGFDFFSYRPPQP